jgi:hypothetical protein
MVNRGGEWKGAYYVPFELRLQDYLTGSRWILFEGQDIWGHSQVDHCRR